MPKITIEEAEKVVGHKLDRRRNYYSFFGDIYYNTSFTAACSGCSDDGEYASSSIGSGCHECGYTGKRVQHWPVPVFMDDRKTVEIQAKGE